MNPEIENLIKMALADGQVTDKEREIILRKAEKLGLDADEVEMYLEGKINSIKLQTTVTAEFSQIKNTHEIKVCKSVIPANLDNEKNLLDAIVKKENQKNLIHNNLIIVEQEYEIQLDYYHKTKALEKENTIKLLENKQIEFDNFLIYLKNNYVLKTKNELDKNKIYNLKFNLKESMSNDFDFLKSDERIKYVIYNSEWKNLGNPFFRRFSFFLCLMLLSIFVFDGMKNYYFLSFSVIFLIIVLFNKSQFILKNSSDKDPLTISGRDILFKRLKDFFIINIESNFTQEIDELTKKNNEISFLKDNINSCDEILINIKSNFDGINKNSLDEVANISDLIAEINKSISFEKKLKKFPSQAIGSVVLYNELNEKYNLYVDNQFNKIIRFLEHIENKEKKYRDLYLNCTENYITDPNGIPFVELKQEKKEIDNCYELLSILVKEVNGDIVKFNKVYNKLEDAGLFMTTPEKANQQYLLEISTKLDNVIEGLKVLFQSLQETNNSLREIEGNTSEISLNMYDVRGHLWDISWETNK